MNITNENSRKGSIRSSSLSLEDINKRITRSQARGKTQPDQPPNYRSTVTQCKTRNWLYNFLTLIFCFSTFLYACKNKIENKIISFLNKLFTKIKKKFLKLGLKLFLVILLSVILFFLIFSNKLNQTIFWRVATFFCLTIKLKQNVLNLLLMLKNSIKVA